MSGLNDRQLAAKIGHRIKVVRKKAKLTQTELANLIGLKLRTIQKYESGEIEPSITVINEIATVIGVSSAELLGYSLPNTQESALRVAYSVVLEIQEKIQNELLADAAEELQYHNEMRGCPDFRKTSVMVAAQILEDYLVQEINRGALIDDIHASAIQRKTGE